MCRCGWGRSPQPEQREGAQCPQPRWEHGHCPLGILAPSAPQILVEERGDGAGSGALQLFKATDPFQPAKARVQEEAEALDSGAGVGVGGTHGPQPRTLGCPELPPTRASVPGGETQHCWPSFSPPPRGAHSTGNISAWKSSRAATSRASAWSSRRTARSSRVGAGPRAVSTPSRCTGTERE